MCFSTLGLFYGLLAQLLLAQLLIAQLLVAQLLVAQLLVAQLLVAQLLVAQLPVAQLPVAQPLVALLFILKSALFFRLHTYSYSTNHRRGCRRADDRQ